jgi:hypothetical protein
MSKWFLVVYAVGMTVFAGIQSYRVREQQEHVATVGPEPKATPINQLIAQCELKARDKYNFSNDDQYREAMDYIKVRMLSIGYELDHDIRECRSTIQSITNPYRKKVEEAKTEAEKKEAEEEWFVRTGQVITTFLPNWPECYRRD